MWANRVAVPNDDGSELTGRDHTNLTKAAPCLVFARVASVGVKPTPRTKSSTCPAWAWPSRVPRPCQSTSTPQRRAGSWMNVVEKAKSYPCRFGLRFRFQH
jgi:hypothetical protein